jgi:hypothetical protein
MNINNKFVDRKIKAKIIIQTYNVQIKNNKCQNCKKYKININCKLVT